LLEKLQISEIPMSDDNDDYIAIEADYHTQSRSKKRKSTTSKIDKQAYSTFCGWGCLPTLRKLHNLAVWIRASPVRYAQWHDAVGQALGTDNATRWNSWYYIIGVAIKKRVEVAQFIEEHSTADTDFALDAMEWDLLEKTHSFLQPFEKSTRMTEQDAASLDRTLKVLDLLLKHYEISKVCEPVIDTSVNTFKINILQEKCSAAGTRDSRMLHAIEMGWFVLDKYYSLTDSSPAYAASILLHPRRRKQYLEKNWPVKWHAPAINKVNTLWQEEYEGRSVERPLQDPPEDTASDNSVSTYEDMLDDLEVDTAQQPTNEDDLLMFITGKVKILPKDVTPLEWWCRSEQRERYPRLSQMAIDIFSIPPMSAEVERIFSGARRTLSWDRASLSPDTVEMIECLGHWLSQDYVEHEDEFKNAIVAAILGDFEEDQQVYASDVSPKETSST